MSSAEQLTIAATMVLAGLVKGVTGLGLPTVGVGLLSLIVSPAEAAALVVVPALVSNVWQMLAGPALRLLCRRLWPMLCGICLGTWAGGPLLGAVNGRLALPALGAALLLYAIAGLCRWHAPPVPAPLVPRLGCAAGVATGLVTVTSLGSRGRRQSSPGTP